MLSYNLIKYVASLDTGDEVFTQISEVDHPN